MFGRNKGKKGNYAYVVARVKAKKAQLMSDDAYQKMLLMSLPEISRFISESGYQKEITDLTAKFDGINLVEHATYQNMARIFEDILHSATGELHDILAIDRERWDIWKSQGHTPRKILRSGCGQHQRGPCTCRKAE